MAVAIGAGVAGRDGAEAFVGSGVAVGLDGEREGGVVAVSNSLPAWNLDRTSVTAWAVSADAGSAGDSAAGTEAQPKMRDAVRTTSQTLRFNIVHLPGLTLDFAEEA